MPRSAYEHRFKPPEFRCKIGHIFPLETLIDEHSDTEERKLYGAIVALEEGASLAEYAAGNGDGNERTRRPQEAMQLRKHAAAIRKTDGGMIPLSRPRYVVVVAP